MVESHDQLTSSFAIAPYGAHGSLTLGAITQPGINNWNLTVEKSAPNNFPNALDRRDFLNGTRRGIAASMVLPTLSANSSALAEARVLPEDQEV